MVQSSPVSFSGLRVLLVDDNPLNQRVLSALLIRLGFEVAMASDGQAGLDKFCAEPRPHVVLMDLRMPNMDGFEATRFMRAHELELGLARTPIIAVTADAFADSRAHAFEVGMDEFLDMPIVPDRLAATLDRLIKR